MIDIPYAMTAAAPVDLVPTPQARVFVPHMPMMRSRTTGDLVPRIDLKPAEAFGELIFLLDWPEIRDMNLLVIYRKLGDKLADYTPDDYILLTGNPVAQQIVSQVASELTDGRVRWLNWNRGAGPDGGRYEAVYFDIDDVAPYLPPQPDDR